MIPADYQPYVDLGIARWSTWEEGRIRNRAFQYVVMADYGAGVIEPVRFGAFLGWCQNYRWWLEIAAALPNGLLAELDLLDIEHQASGHSTIAWFCNAMPVEIAPRYVDFAAELCRSRYHVIDYFLNSWGETERRVYVSTYCQELAAAGLTVQLPPDGGQLMESVYPLDATDQNLAAFLAGPETALDALQPILERPTARETLALFIIADNSD